MNDPDSTPVDFAETIAIVGVGLIGGSIAAALKKRGFAGQIIGIGRNASRLAAAKKAGLIDESALQTAQVQADLWVFCTPVDQIAAGVLEVEPIPARTVLVTDAGSVKQPICDMLRGRLPKGVEFIGSHPLAGSEKRGFEHADADLFVDRVCVLTPEASTDKSRLALLRAFWEHLGMQVLEMPADAHDRALAETSHLPHLAAAALVSALDGGNAHLAATGFADTTRIASGDPELWTAIFLQNREGVLAALEKYSDRLEEFRRALKSGDPDSLIELLEAAKQKRDGMD